MKTFIRCKAVSETMENLGISLARLKNGIKSLIIRGDEGEITGGITVDENNDATKVFVQNGSNTTSLTLHATDGGEHYAELGTPSANAPSLAVVNKAYVESTEEGGNNLLHKEGDEFKNSGSLVVDRTAQIYDHGRIFRQNATNPDVYYKFCSCSRNGDLRAVITVATLNSWGVALVTHIGGNVNAVNLIGTPLSYVGFDVRDDGDGIRRSIWVKRTVNGDFIVNAVNLNINGVRSDSAVTRTIIGE